MTDSDRHTRLGTAGRVTALVSSVMDLHVRIALQEVDREKRRLISGGLLLAAGSTLALMALVAAEAALVLWLRAILGWEPRGALLAVVVLNLGLAGLSLRVGGALVRGPYLPQTLEGLGRTTRAVLGR
ncbi:phage holin family protein [cyanobiont of Ornithocercus magnificus]|nr:phage holin family protein [cyanobiont of Ornithocercus magnificus]